jgi:hypothetical protein
MVKKLPVKFGAFTDVEIRNAINSSMNEIISSNDDNYFWRCCDYYIKYLN